MDRRLAASRTAWAGRCPCSSAAVPSFPAPYFLLFFALHPACPLRAERASRCSLSPLPDSDTIPPICRSALSSRMTAAPPSRLRCSRAASRPGTEGRCLHSARPVLSCSKTVPGPCGRPPHPQVPGGGHRAGRRFQHGALNIYSPSLPFPDIFLPRSSTALAAHLMCASWCLHVYSAACHGPPNSHACPF